MPTKHTGPVVEIVNSDEQHIRIGHNLCRLTKRLCQQDSQATKPDADETKEVQYCKSLSCQAEEQRVFSITGTVLFSAAADRSA